MKWRHDNPHAERQIEAFDLPRWLSRRELAGLAEREALAAKRAAELLAVDWAALSPAELAFRWLLEHPSEYAAWAHETREAWKTRREATGHKSV